MSETLKDQLIRHEGLRLKPYRDSVGKLTIGVGRNLDDIGITKSEAMFLLDNDILRATLELYAAFPWTKRLDEARRAVLINMTFNLGIERLTKFKQTLAAIESGEYKFAASHMLDSLWAKQVKGRAVELAKIMETGLMQAEI